MASEVVEIEGHIIDSLILAKVLDLIVDAGADYRIIEVDIGRTRADASRVRLEVVAADAGALGPLLSDLGVHGVNRVAEV